MTKPCVHSTGMDDASTPARWVQGFVELRANPGQ